MRRTSLESDLCPIARTLDVVGDWWSLLIIRSVAAGVTRFGALQASLGIARNILAERLRYLVRHGVLELRASGTGERRDYLLTDKGRDLFPVLVALRQWGETHMFDRDAPGTELLDSQSLEPLPRLEVRAADGRTLTMGDSTLRPVTSAR